MNYNELEKMHNDLLPLCNKSLVSGLVWYDENIPYENKKSEMERINRSIGDLIPENKQIYGCKTFGDAEKLNQKIVKRLDELYDNQK